jgi:peptidoglycan/LPS O-acetylase OafA/YrhL
LGVIIFFVISGFLVSKSFSGRGNVVAFVAARILRIYPGLIAATLFSAALAGALSAVPWRDFLADRQTLEFLRGNSLGIRIAYELPGVFIDNPFPRAVNGSLWTIPIELRMYVACALAGILTLLVRRALFNAVLAAAFGLFALRPHWFLYIANAPGAPELAMAFALGAFAWVNRDWIPLSPLAAACALLVLAINPGDIIRSGLWVPLVAYVVLTVALHPMLRFAAFNRLGDYSYGLYLYAYPIQQSLVQTQPGIGSLPLFAEAFALTLAVAVASWHGIESPALELKSRLSGLSAKPQLN